MKLYIDGAFVKLISYRGEAALFAAPPLGWIPHVQQGNGSLYGWMNGLVKPDRKFPHAWVSKAGRIEQYQTLDRQAWAQSGGNSAYWSVEVEGYTHELYTGAQLLALRRIHAQLGVDNRLANKPGERGVGTHYMGGAAWGGHSCPGPVRAAQRGSILAPTHLPPVTVKPVLRTPPYPGLIVFGSKNMYVKTIQNRLNYNGARLLSDGIFGTSTLTALLKFQRARKLVADGKVGPLTWKALFTL